MADHAADDGGQPGAPAGIFGGRQESPEPCFGNDWPYDTEPHKSLAVRRFANTAISEMPNLSDIDFIRMVMCGRAIPEEPHLESITVRISADLDVEAGVGSSFDYTVLRDYDSAFGTSYSLPLRCPLAYFLVPNFRLTIKSDIHLPITITYNEQAKAVPAHKIPNFAIGETGRRGQVYVLLPALYAEGSVDRRVPTPLFEQWYHRVFLPAFSDVLPEHVAHLDSTYRNAMKRAYDTRTKQISLTSTDIPGDMVLGFGAALRHHADISGVPEFQGFLFLVVLRGTKGQTPHDHRQAARTLERYLEDIDPQSLEQDPWFVDAACEISRRHHVLKLFTHAHPGVIRYMCPRVPDNLLQRTLEKRVTVDYAAQLYGLSGFRCTPSQDLRFDGCLYLNVYTTDKSFHYTNGANIYSHLDYNLLFPPKAQELTKKLDGMLDGLYVSRHDENGGLIANAPDGAIRLEMRVPMSTADTFLPYLSFETFRPWVCPIPSPDWWNYIYARLAAAKKLAVMLIAAPADARTWPRSLLLGIALVDYVNSTFTTEPQGDRHHAVRQAVGRFIKDLDDGDDDDDAILVPVDRLHGAFFFADIWFNDLGPRFPRAVIVDAQMITRFFRTGSLIELQRQFGGAAGSAIVRGPRHGNPARTHNRTERHFRVQDVRAEPAAHVEPFKLQELGVTQHAVVRMGQDPPGGYVNPEFSDGDDDMVDARGVNEKVLDMWVTFPYDVIASCSNRKPSSEASYLLIPEAQHTRIDHSIFMRADLGAIFSHILIRPCTKPQWMEVFAHYFPDKGYKPPPRLQHYPLLPYYRDWAALRGTMSKQNVHLVRTHLKQRFDKLLWVPYAHSDRLWRTSYGRDPRDVIRLPAGHKGLGVVLAMNPKLWPTHRGPILSGAFDADDEGDEPDDLMDVDA